MEYLADLEYYYKYSYGNALAKVLPCALIKSMIEAVDNSNTSTANVIVNFGHAKTLLLLVTALGIKRDATPLLASNYEQQQNRQFRLSAFDSFAANFAAVKYNCPSPSGGPANSSAASSSSESSSDGNTKILMLLNQEPIEMPFCAGGSICTIDELLQMFYSSEMSKCPHGICGIEFANAKDLGSDYRC